MAEVKPASTKPQEDKREGEARQLLKKQADERAKMNAETEKRMAAKPTPTQEENDLANLGVHLWEHDDDGSGPQPFLHRAVESQPAGVGYQTREHTPAHQHRPPPPPPPKS